MHCVNKDQAAAIVKVPEQIQPGQAAINYLDIRGLRSDRVMIQIPVNAAAQIIIRNVRVANTNHAIHVTVLKY